MRLASLLVSLAVPFAALAQAFPSRTITIVVPYSPGSTSDLLPRAIAPHLSQSLGVPALPVQTPFNLYLASVSVSYTFDLFGANRRELEGLQAGIDYQRYELEAARLTLAGNVVTAAIREASLREQIAATQEIVELQERQLAITERLVKLGTAAQADAVAQRLDLAQIRAVLPDLQRQLEQVRHRLAVYIGQPPGTAKLAEFKLTDLQLPPELPLSLPSELARQRPDIRAAEALLQQAGARVGVATANLYPQIAHPDLTVPLVLYGEQFSSADLAEIPEADLPPGLPGWMRSPAAWAQRTGTTAASKRSTITITIPDGA